MIVMSMVPEKDNRIDDEEAPLEARWVMNQMIKYLINRTPLAGFGPWIGLPSQKSYSQNSRMMWMWVRDMLTILIVLFLQEIEHITDYILNIWILQQSTRFNQ